MQLPADHRHKVPHKVEIRCGERVAVSSGHHLASQAAVDTYLAGGNIIDAAIVGGTVLGTLLPYACGLGGDAYLLYFNATDGKVYALNGTGASPSGATPAKFADRIPSIGIYSSTVPGALALWDDALALFGTLSLSAALKPAIAYAREGFPVHLGLIENIEEKRELIARDVEASRIFLPEMSLEIGQPFQQPDLARVLEQIAERGAQDFYTGALARELTDKLVDAGALFALDDFNRHRTLEQTPIQACFYGHDILTMPPNSVGLQLLLQLLALQSVGIADIDPASPEFWRVTIAAWRWSLSASQGVIGDPRDAEGLASIILKSAPDFSSSPFSCGRLPVQQSGDTSNLVIMDYQGNAVSLVQSVSAPFASGVVLPGTGILMNNRMRGFDNAPGTLNSVGPGRRPKHTLVPALVMTGGRAVMSIGTPGAAGQPLTLAQVLSRIVAHGQDPANAVQESRWSVGLKNEIIVENATPPEIVQSLRLDDDNLAIMSERHVRFGSVKIATIEGDHLRAVSDFRRVAGTAAN